MSQRSDVPQRSDVYFPPRAPEKTSMEDGRRSEPRWHYLDFVAYEAASGRGEGHLANVSETGVFVRTANPPRLGESVQIVLKGPRPTIALEGRVRWVGRRSDGSEGFGAQLVDPPAAYVELVQSISASRQQDDARPRRVAPRLLLSIPVAVEFGTTCDDGTLCDISLSGARLENTGIRPPEGSQVNLTFTLDGQRKAFEVIARVVRATESGGYAVQFEAINTPLKEALEHASAVLRQLPASSSD